MAKKPRIITMILRCTETDTGAHCWHYSKHDHEFNKCCFCKKTGQDIFGTGYASEKVEEKVKNVSGA